MHVVIFEGSRWAGFAPVALSRPVFLLRSGMSTLLEKSLRWLKPARVTLWVRPGLAQWCRQVVVPQMPVPCEVNRPLDDEPALLVSGSTVALGPFEIPDGPAVCADESGGIGSALVRLAGLSADDCLRRSDAWLAISELPRYRQSAKTAAHLWDLIACSEQSIAADAGQWRDQAAVHPAGPYHMVNERDVLVAAGAVLEPGCVLDASKGAVVVEAGAVIGANAVLKGPCCVGRDSQVMPRSFIRAGTSIGPNCRIGGEVSNSVFVANANKAHDGFVGDSYIGEWVNLGAATNTSNLKNTYGKIRIRIGNREIQTDRQFLGALIGDHSKTGIGTRLTSGSYVGYCSMIACSRIPAAFTPSFSFVTDKGGEEYRLEKAREVMSLVYARRGRSWSEADEAMLNHAVETSRIVEKA